MKHEGKAGKERDRRSRRAASSRSSGTAVNFVRILGVLSLMLLAGVCRGGDDVRYEEERPKMGTFVRITLYTDDPAKAAAAFEAGFRRFDEINASMSDYDSESEILRLTRAADGDAEPVWRPVSDDLFAVLAEAKKFYELSDGAFDVTVAPLSKLWRRARRLQAFPEPHLLEKAKKLVGSDAIELDAARQRVRFTRPGLRIDLGGIAKGYAIDEAFAAIRGLWIDRVLVDAGGDMRLGHAPPVAPSGDVPAGWHIGFAPPRKDGDPLFYEHLADRAIAVSGDTFRGIEIDGVRYSHLIDPKTGIGLTHHLTVVVYADRAVVADALASAVSVLGIAKGLALIGSLDGVDALIIHQPVAER